MADAWRYEDRYPDTDIYYDCVEDLDLESLRCAIADLCGAMTQVITRCDGLWVARLTEYPSSPPPSPPTLVLPPSPAPLVLFEDKAARKAACKAERRLWTEMVATDKAERARKEWAEMVADAAFPACKSDDDDFPFSLFYKD